MNDFHRCFALHVDLQSASRGIRSLDPGTKRRLMVEGNAILDGSLAHAIKPGDEIWMIEAVPALDFVSRGFLIRS